MLFLRWNHRGSVLTATLPGAEQQIDRFLEQVRAALQRIHIEMGDIDVKRGESREP